jgi:hypothetical protein
MRDQPRSIYRRAVECKKRHEIGLVADDRRRTCGRTEFQNRGVHIHASLGQIGFADLGGARAGEALERAYLLDLSKLPGNEPSRNHGRAATMVLGGGVARSRVHLIPLDGCTSTGMNLSWPTQRRRYTPQGYKSSVGHKESAERLRVRRIRSVDCGSGSLFDSGRPYTWTFASNAGPSVHAHGHIAGDGHAL